jgi:hypothetical protein
MRPRHAAAKTFGAATIIVAVLVFCGSVVAAAGFYAIQSATSNKYSSGTLQLEGATTPSCYSTGTGGGGTVNGNYNPCTSGSPVPTGTLSNTASSSASTAIDSVGSLNASAATVALASCGPPQMVDTAGGNTGLAYGALTFQNSGPLATTAITTNGSTGWGETINSYANPETFSVVAWFRTTGAGGIIGFANAQNPTTATPGDHDRLLWIDNTGKLVWGIYSGAVDEVTSTAAYNDGNWHMAVAEIGSSGESLWVDGARVANTTTVTTAQTYTGWWSIGYASTTNWADAPTSDYFNGSIAQVAVIPSQLVAAQITTLYSTDTTLTAYTGGVNALGPTNYWQLNDTGTVPYEGTVPGGTASTTVYDASGNANTGTAEGGTTLGAAGPTTLGANGLSLNGTSGWVQTTTSYANPETFSVVAWFKTATSGGGTGGSILGFTSTQGNGAPANSDRAIWLDNSGKLVWGVFPTAGRQELTSSAAYNNANWHMVVAEIGSAGQELWVDGTEVAFNTVTSASSYTGYWHLGWAYETNWTDPPTNAYLTGSLSEVAVVPSQLSGTQVANLYHATSTAQFALDVGALSPTSYWPMQDSASNICGTVEITVQATAGATNTCVYPTGAGACAAPSATYLVPGLGVRSFTPPTSGTPVTIKVTMELTAAAPAALAGLQLLPCMAFALNGPSGTVWAAQISYSAGMVLL